MKDKASLYKTQTGKKIPGSSTQPGDMGWGRKVLPQGSNLYPDHSVPKGALEKRAQTI